MVEYVTQNGLIFGVFGTIVVVLLGFAGLIAWSERNHH